jgi:hypothetical protein
MIRTGQQFLLDVESLHGPAVVKASNEKTHFAFFNIRKRWLNGQLLKSISIVFHLSDSFRR